jgi:hypothetical protein
VGLPRGRIALGFYHRWPFLLFFFVTMASSNFTFDQWDEVLASMQRQDASAVSSSPSPGGVLPTPSTLSSGEFHPYSLIGSALAGGVSSTKTFSLCVPSLLDSVCLGIISGTKFCLKDEASGSKCTVASHIKKFSPSPEAFYIKEIETKAWCKPVYNGAGFTSEQRSFLLTHQLSRGDWDETFAQLGQGIVPDWIVTAGGEKLWSSSKPEFLKTESDTKSDDLVLVSPKLANVETGLFQLIPALSYDSVEETPSA